MLEVYGDVPYVTDEMFVCTAAVPEGPISDGEVDTSAGPSGSDSEASVETITESRDDQLRKIAKSAFHLVTHLPQNPFVLHAELLNYAKHQHLRFNQRSKT